LPTNFDFGFPAISTDLPADWRDELWRSADRQGYNESKHAKHEVSWDTLVEIEGKYHEVSIINPAEEAMCLLEAAELTNARIPLANSG
jgi:hypothetical protein